MQKRQQSLTDENKIRYILYCLRLLSQKIVGYRCGGMNQSPLEKQNQRMKIYIYLARNWLIQLWKRMSNLRSVVQVSSKNLCYHFKAGTSLFWKPPFLLLRPSTDQMKPTQTIKSISFTEGQLFVNVNHMYKILPSQKHQYKILTKELGTIA